MTGMTVLMAARAYSPMSADPMQIIHIDHRNVELEAQGRKIVARSAGVRKATVPMRLVERLVITSSAKISATLMLKLNEQRTGVLILPSRYRGGRPLHIAEAATDAELVRAQILTAGSPGGFALALQFVRMKLSAQILLLQELEACYGAKRRLLKEACQQLQRARGQLDLPDLGLKGDMDRLRGIEGAASARFFKAWGQCFAPALKFNTRNRRPPMDPVNVCLSIGYTLAHHEALIAACTRGLAPHVGFLHDPRANRDSLACDIVEAVRPVIDRWVLQLFRAKTLRPEHFSTTPGGCLLGKAGRKLVYADYFENTAHKVARVCASQAGWIRHELGSKANPPLDPAPSQLVTLDDRK
ncbi:MAG TPA: CRISPR-associated endonuclease Cas1 [Devosia sp.]|nr:CRISPR-associated endonuclease Cas1 [Devosia sp.]